MPDAPMPPIKTIDITEASEMVSSGAMLIDVREQQEWDQARIPGAEFKPLSQANSWYEALPDAQEIVFYCRSGNRSGQIVRALTDQIGMTNVYNMAGGILAWADKELPLEN